MSYEVEVKYRAVDHGRLVRLLTERGAVATAVADQEDLYLNHPARDFAQTKEAFRIRRIGEETRLTYKGPRHAGPTKTREEIEIPVAAGADQFAHLVRLFETLGFRPVATVRKHREAYHLTYHNQGLEVALDTAEGLGAFAEIEAFAASESELPQAQAAVLALAKELGLTEVEPRSYLRMVLEEL